MKIKVLFGLALSALLTFEIQAALPPVTPSLVAESTSVRAGGELWAGVKFPIPEGWHLYWRNPGDTGQPPRIEWRLPEGFQAGGLQWPTPHRITAGPVVNYGYDGTLLLMAHVAAPKALQAPSASFKAHVKWLVCKDQCIPGEADLSLDLPVNDTPPEKSADAALFASAREKLIVPAPAEMTASATATEDGFKLRVAGASFADDVAFFPLHKREIDNTALQKVSHDGDALVLELKKSPLLEEAPKALEGILVTGRHGYQVTAPIGVASGGGSLLLQALLLAFLGGIILNLMPCVFPVLSIKAFSLLSQMGEEKRVVRLHGILYTVGVVVSFWAMAGVLIALRAGGEKLGWGFQLQSPAFDAALALVLFTLSLSLLGVFELGGSLSNVGSGLASKGGYIGSFFTGVLATVVATPCTAPFMGTALGFAATRPAAEAFLVFTALALGMALPYLALSFTPAIGHYIPRPGRWMESVKQFMAFPLFGTVIWLTWIVGLQGGMISVTKLLVAFLCLGLAAWVYGRWSGKISKAVLASLLASVSWIGIVDVAGPAGAKDAAIVWQPYSHARLAELRSEGKPVFIDFTAAWCVTCKVNETVALSAPSVAKTMKERGIATLKGDWTNSDAEITRALNELGRDGVPLYVLYPAKKDTPPTILPQILTERTVREALEKLN